MSLPSRLREALPLSLRRALRLGQRYAVDLYRGADLSPPEPYNISQWHEATCVRQPLTSTPRAEAKRHNIALAAAAFSSRPIAPRGVMSFWGWLGAPTTARGFREGRALRHDRLVLETGGGLCQLAGALYSAGLQSGLDAIERHAHSHDLYTDETRFTPLGSDATVSFGFKDLRLRNPHDVDVAFVVHLDDAELTVRVLSPRPIAATRAEFRVVASGADFVETETHVDGRLLVRKRYLRGPGSAAPS